jgi:outer membrane protein
MVENNSSSAPMRLRVEIWIGLLCTVLSLQAQTNPVTKPISLQECIRLALENNFDIAIERYRPRLAAYNLGADYGYYDPIFSIEGRHEFETAEGEFDPRTGIQFPAGSGRETDAVDVGLQGVLWPTGLRYDIDADYQHRTGTTLRDIVTIDQRDGPTRTIQGFVPFDQYSSDINITLTQPLLRDFWIDKGRLSIKLNKKDVRISEYQLLFVIMDEIHKVEQTYYRLIEAIDQVSAAAKSVELAERLLGENRKRIEIGTMAPLDEKQAESEAALRRSELLERQRVVTLEENILKNLISNQYQQWHGVRLVPAEKLLAVAQTFDIQESWISALNQRPDFNRVKEELERQGLIVKYDFNQLFPYLNLIGNYGRRGFDELVYRRDTQRDVFIVRNGVLTTNDVTTLVRARDSSYSRTLADIADEVNPSYMYGAVLSFPLSFRKERYNYKGSRAEEERQKLEVQKLHQKILIEIDDAIQAAKTAFERVRATREGRELAEVALDAEQKKLDNGRSTSFAVLRLQRDLTQARALEIDALSDYNTALSDLYFREGRILEKKGIKVEVK